MFRLLISLGLLALILSTSCVIAQESKPQWQRLLQSEDAKKAAELQKQLNVHAAAARWAEAVQAAQELYQLRESKQGKDHWETVKDKWQLKALQTVKSAPPEKQKRYAEVEPFWEQADQLENRAQYPAALVLRQQILQVNRDILGEDHLYTSIGYLNVASVQQIQGKYAEAEQGFRKALGINLRLLGEEHLQTAVSYNNLALVLENQGKYREAEQSYRKSLEIRLRVLGSEHSSTATIYNNLANLQSSQARYAEAEQGYRKALAICRKELGEEHPNTATSHDNLAMVLLDQGKYVEAEQGCRTALAIRRKTLGEEHPETASSYNNLAALQRVQGRVSEAEQGFRKALAIKRKMLGEEHPDTANSYNNLAQAQGLQANYAEAEQGLLKALVIQRKMLGEEHAKTATSYHNLAEVQLFQAKYAEAEQGNLTALAIKRKVLSEEHPDTALSHNNLASVRQAQSKYGEAEQGYRKALAIYRKVLGEQHPYTGGVYHNLAKVQQAQGKYAEAEDNAARSVAIFTRTRMMVASTGLERAPFVSEHSPLPRLAALLARNGKSTQAWQRFEESLGRGTSDDFTARLKRPAEVRERQNQLNGQLKRLEQQLTKLIAMKELSEQPTQQRKQLLTQMLEAQNALAQLQRELEDKYGPVEGKVLDIATLQQALAPDSAYIGWLDRKGEPKAVDPNGEHWAILLKAKGDPIWVKLSGRGKDGAWIDADDQLPVNLREALATSGDWQPLAQQLKKQRLDPLAEHLRDVKQLIVLPSGFLQGIPLEVLSDQYTISYAISASLYAYQKQQQKKSAAGLLALGDPTFKSPDQPTLPLPPGGVLLTAVLPGAPGALRGLRPGDVLLRYEQAELNSLADLQKAVAGAKQEAEVRVWRLEAGLTKARELTLRVPVGKLGVVVADQPAPKALLAQREGDNWLTSRGETWKQLPGTRYEVSAISKLFADKPTLLFGSEANETRLTQLAQDGTLSKARFVHLATHGEARNDKPLSSRIILARDKISDDVRGELVAEQILLNWTLNAELVTLSACQTGLGKYESGEGYVGFAQALLLTGTRSVCLSLWNVNDVSTALLMERFYDNVLTKKMGKAAALADAKRWLRTLPREEALKRLETIGAGVERGPGAKELPRIKLPETPKDQPPYAHPHYWAPFILVGERD